MVKFDVSSSTNASLPLCHPLIAPSSFPASLCSSSSVSSHPTRTQDHLCSVGDVLEGKGGGVYATVEVLLSMAPPLVSLSPQVQLAGFALFYLSVMSVLCAIYVHLAPHV